MLNFAAGRGRWPAVQRVAGGFQSRSFWSGHLDPGLSLGRGHDGVCKDTSHVVGRLLKDGLLAGDTPELLGQRLIATLEQHGPSILYGLSQILGLSFKTASVRKRSGDHIFSAKTAPKQEEAVEQWRVERKLLSPWTRWRRMCQSE